MSDQCGTPEESAAWLSGFGENGGRPWIACQTNNLLKSLQPPIGQVARCLASVAHLRPFGKALSLV